MDWLSTEMPLGAKVAASTEEDGCRIAGSSLQRVEVRCARGRWTPYEDVACAEICRARQLGESTCKVEVGGWAYVVNLEKMSQLNISTGSERPIRFISAASMADINGGGQWRSNAPGNKQTRDQRWPQTGSGNEDHCVKHARLEQRTQASSGGLPSNLGEHTPLTLPAWWTRGSRSVLDAVDWYLNRFSLELGPEAMTRWEMFASWMCQRERDTFQREVKLYAFAQDAWWSGAASCLFIDVHQRRVTGKPGHIVGHSSMRYPLSQVTGVDFCVQGCLVMQPIVVDVLFEAVKTIVEQNVDEFAFVCHGGTHRSVGCCFLLAILAFPRARIILTTRRTRDAAAKQGLELR